MGFSVLNDAEHRITTAHFLQCSTKSVYGSLLHTKVMQNIRARARARARAESALLFSKLLCCLSKCRERLVSLQR